MTKEALVLLVLVAAAAIGIIFVVKKASSNEGDWEAYRAVEIGDTRTAIQSKFPTASEDVQSLSDAGGLGLQSAFKETTKAGGVRLIVIKSQNDSFLFGFDKEDKLVYKDFRQQE